MKISIIMPVHNEEKYLLDALKPIEKLKIHEIIFVLDNCTDNSEKIVRGFTSKHRNSKIVYMREHKWLNKAFETYDFGAQHATGEYIFFVGSDVIVDPQIFTEKHCNRHNALKFHFHNYDLYGSKIGYAYEKVLFTILNKLGFANEQCFVEAFRKNYWQKTRHENPPEDIVGFIKRPKEVLRAILEETHEIKFKHITNVECLHLRPKLTKEQQLLRGLARYILEYPFWKVLLHSILLSRIYILIGYFHAKYNYRKLLEELTKNIKLESQKQID